MAKFQKYAVLLLSSTAAPLVFPLASAHAQSLPLINQVVDTTTSVTSPVTAEVTTTTAEVTTTTATQLTETVPLTEPVLTATSPLIVAVPSTVGTVTTTTTALGSVVANSPSTVSSLLAGDGVFTNPELNMIDPKWGKIRSFWGKIRSFEGEEVSPFWGKIRAFWGDTGPFEGDMAGFWGNLRTYNDGSDPNAVEPEWGKIRSFWDGLGTDWGRIRTFWDTIGGSSDPSQGYATLSGQLGDIVDRSALFWGDAVEAKTGKDFYAGFASSLLSRYGIDLNDPATLAALDVNEREHFFLEWYDGLMQFSGADNPDHWMRQVRWSPRITETMGEGKDSVIGLLDFTVTGAEAGNITHYDGVSNFANGHGAAVASLMVAAHDGKGVMGIAPMASVVAYNPFDATETAGWSDIRDGIRSLGSHGASIINMSLGVSGWTLHPDWNGVLNDPLIALTTASSVFVIAAGNDGITQATNIEWSNKANFIVVGSVDPAGAISEFSNRPGNTCLLVNGKCSDKLVNHFMVAPGEMILVSDGHGGVTRYSGTSFAAPLVSGTVALIHDRWPWLSKYPKETVTILLSTAKDLGAPGIDPVYGVGQLDVTAALSPIDLSKLSWYKVESGGRSKAMSSSTVRHSSNLAKWEAAGVYFIAFEKIGGTYRDFAIPLSTKLIDQSALSAGMTEERFQAYLYNQVTDWIRSGPRFAPGQSLNFATTTASLPSGSGFNVSMSVAPRTVRKGFREGQLPYQMSFRIADAKNRFALRIGQGDGAVELGNSMGFSHASDYDPGQGGANPLLGMASGDGFVQASYALSKTLTLSAGLTSQSSKYDQQDMPLADRLDYQALDGYRTNADTVALTWRPAASLELTGSYTRLHEKDAILGIQALDPELIGRGSRTTGFTLNAAYWLTPTLRISVSGTVGRTNSLSSDALIGASGFKSTAYQLTLLKQDLLGRGDSLRLTLAQPLHVEAGKLSITSMQVIDRQTGELGMVTNEFALPAKKRPLVGELHYGRSLLDGQADLALFGRAQLAGEPAIEGDAKLIGGVRFTLRY